MTSSHHASSDHLELISSYVGLDTCCEDECVELVTSTTITITNTTTLLAGGHLPPARPSTLPSADPAVAAFAAAAFPSVVAAAFADLDLADADAVACGVSSGVTEAVAPLVPAVEALATPSWVAWGRALVPAVIIVAGAAVCGLVDWSWSARGFWARRQEVKDKKEGQGAASSSSNTTTTSTTQSSANPGALAMKPRQPLAVLCFLLDPEILATATALAAIRNLRRIVHPTDANAAPVARLSHAQSDRHRPATKSRAQASGPSPRRHWQPREGAAGGNLSSHRGHYSSAPAAQRGRRQQQDSSTNSTTASTTATTSRPSLRTLTQQESSIVSFQQRSK